MLVQRATTSQERWNSDSDHRIPTQHAESRRPCRVLVVDDDDVTRDCMSALLKRERYEVELAASGEEALRVMSTTHCDIVLTDWQMPNMDGLELCRHVRLEYQEDSVYVLLFTVRESLEDRLAGMAAGADEYVIKGGPIREILARLNARRSIPNEARSLPHGNREHRRILLTDPLTSAHNLRYFNNQLPREIERARRSRHALAVLHCRIDEFEQTNDRFGHEVGDEALRAFVADSRNCIRKNCDWLARVGANQFMIVLPETRFTRADRVARKLRQIFAAVPVSTPLGPIGFTVSIAVTACEPKHGIDTLPQMEDLLRSTNGNSLH
ncbi:MAG TPA: diguanylate cyclase [Steroidobacteraceae bacterium]|nr:diguanylate cyclase [Steroidobacteraceae bacterium]